uniref:Uncharacterized protein n=1 Tax=Podarcis muralis TaxID=64176 RepID=A0A670ICL5_PODMU
MAQHTVSHRNALKINQCVPMETGFRPGPGTVCPPTSSEGWGGGERAFLPTASLQKAVLKAGGGKKSPSPHLLLRKLQGQEGFAAARQHFKAMPIGKFEFEI